jgi:hypothetical protein
MLKSPCQTSGKTGKNPSAAAQISRYVPLRLFPILDDAIVLCYYDVKYRFVTSSQPAGNKPSGGKFAGFTAVADALGNIEKKKVMFSINITIFIKVTFSIKCYLCKINKPSIFHRFLTIKYAIFRTRKQGHEKIFPSQYCDLLIRGNIL